jgi:bacillithiol system protein YtxJ
MIRPLADEADLETVLAAPLAVVYKHSPRCGVCISSLHEVRYFAEGHVDVPVYQIDVVANRALARTIAKRVGVRHESPQVIVMAEGRAVWDASHWDIRASDLAEQAKRHVMG